MLQLACAVDCSSIVSLEKLSPGSRSEVSLSIKPLCLHDLTILRSLVRLRWLTDLKA